MKRLRPVDDCEPRGVETPHGLLIHDMRLAIARILDPVSAFCYALANKENYFLVLGSPLFKSVRERTWDGKTIVSMSFRVSWTQLALAPTDSFKRIVVHSTRASRACTRRTLWFSSVFVILLVVFDSPSPDFLERFQCLLDAMKNEPLGWDLLRMAICWGNFEIAEFIASHPRVGELTYDPTLISWRSRDISCIAHILLNGYCATREETTFQCEPYDLILDVVGSLVPLLRRFLGFLEKIEQRSLIAFCSCFWAPFCVWGGSRIEPFLVALRECHVGVSNDLKVKYDALMSHPILTSRTLDDVTQQRLAEFFPESVLRVVDCAGYHWSFRIVCQWATLLTAQ
jgi:hypothetical protein